LQLQFHVPSSAFRITHSLIRILYGLKGIDSLAATVPRSEFRIPHCPQPYTHLIRLGQAAWIPALPVPDRGFGIRSGMTGGDSPIVMASLRLLIPYPSAHCSLLIVNCKLLISYPRLPASTLSLQQHCKVTYSMQSILESLCKFFARRLYGPVLRNRHRLSIN
jgi:hypothetical protein